MRKQPVTSYDVAKLAGVSQPTVSRAFAPNGNISPHTRDRVMKAAQQLGYQPNAIARGLTTQRTNIIGIIMGNISRSLFYPKVLDIFAHRLQAIDKQVLFFNTHETRSVDEILPRIMSYRVDALLIASTTPGRELVDQCSAMGMPVVLLNRTVPKTSANSVCNDNEMGGRQIADLLLDAGHRHLAFMAGVGVTSTNLQRQKGFRDRLKERGYNGLLHADGEYTYETGYKAALQLLDCDNPPDAIFCAADIMALGAMDAARHKLGINIPGELSVIGYDDIPMAGWSSYDLTTIRQPINEMVDRAIELLVPVEDEVVTGQISLLAGEVIRRGSARLAPVTD